MREELRFGEVAQASLRGGDSRQGVGVAGGLLRGHGERAGYRCRHAAGADRVRVQAVQGVVGLDIGREGEGGITEKFIASYRNHHQ